MIVYDSPIFLYPWNVGLRGTVQEDPPEAVRRRVGLYQHNTLEAQPAPGAPIAPSDGVERSFTTFGTEIQPFGSLSSASQ
ncbi:AGAP012766-PA [Anopheles gambiae str. PEST]|uniref:AGAP012766-PA n=1 Tax=Anopheles gambiae TaxID=7165 RepID=A0NAW1_ANOGA|nr:AGAP012766-PA [Anopheles gambiae str. PEST]